MKKLFTLFLLLQTWGLLQAQAPEAMSFQAVIRDANSNLIQNTPVGIQISILQGSVNGLASYIERHAPTTNENGLASLKIGNGTAVSGSFATIDWSNGPYFLKTETDPSGGTSYSISGTSQLLSVPYALHAATAGSVTEADPVFGSSVAGGITASDVTNWNDDLVDDADADPGNEIQTLSFSNDTLSVSGGNFVLLPQDQDWNKAGNSVYNVNDSIGIGTNSPLSNLDVVGGFRYEDGNQMEGRFLVSDSTGLAKWDTFINPTTFYATNPAWTITGPAGIETTYCTATVTISKRSLVVVNSFGHINASQGSDIAIGIVFPGETLNGASPNVYTDLRQAQFSSCGPSFGWWDPISTSRSKILEPGTHQISLRFICFAPGNSGQMNGASISGYVIPFN